MELPKQITFTLQFRVLGELSRQEVEEAYEVNTGKVIVATLRERNIDSMEVPGVLVKSHGPFSWGKDVAASVYHAVVVHITDRNNNSYYSLQNSSKVIGLKGREL